MNRYRLFCLALPLIACKPPAETPPADEGGSETDGSGSTTAGLDESDDSGTGADSTGDTGMNEEGKAVAVFSAYNFDSERGELFATLEDRSAVWLSGEGWIQGFSVSPSREHAIYLADDDPQPGDDPDNPEMEFHVVTTDGTSNEVASGPAIGFNAVWSADGSAVAFIAEGNAQVWSIAEGSASTVGPSYWDSVVWPSPDGASLAYEDADGALVVGPADGSADPFVLSNDGGAVTWTPDGARLVYGAGDPLSLRAADADGANDVELTAAVSGVGILNFERPSYALAPDGSRVAFRSAAALWSVLLDGTDLQQVNGPLVMDGAVLVGLTSWSPDSQRIAYIADQETNGLAELYASNPDGSGNVKLSAGEAIAEFQQPGAGFRVPMSWSPDSTLVTYAADTTGDGTQQLVVVDASGGSAPQVISSPGTDVTVGSDTQVSFGWSPSGECIVYGSGDDGFGGPAESFVSVLGEPSTDCGFTSEQPSADPGPGGGMAFGPLRGDECDGLVVQCWLGEVLLTECFDPFSRFLVWPDGTVEDFAKGVDVLGQFSVEDIQDCGLFGGPGYIDTSLG